MRRVIGIVSGKGGVGKTTVTINLGLALHKLGEEVVILDGNLKNPNFGFHLGIFEYDLSIHDALERDLALYDAMHIHKSGLRFIPAHLSLHYMNVDASGLKRVFKDFDTQVLVDSPPGLDGGALSVLESCDDIIVVTTPHLSDLADCMKTIQVARDFGVHVNGIVINSVRKKDYEISREEIEAITGLKVIHTIPWDENVLRSVALKNPIVERKPYSPASIAFYELAAKVAKRTWKKPRFLAMKRLLS